MLRKIRPHINKQNFITLAVLAVIAYMVFATGKVIAKNFALQQEVDRLTREIELLNIRNQELGYQLAYYQTDAYADKEARDKLGLKAPGEQVVIFPNRVPQGLATDQKPEVKPPVEEAVDNLREWLYFLFRQEPT